MPAAGGQPLEDGVLCCCLVEMEGLRVELPGEGLDLLGIERMDAAGEALADLDVVEIEALVLTTKPDGTRITFAESFA